MAQTENTGIVTKQNEAADYLFTIIRELEKLARGNDMHMLANMLSISKDEAKKYCVGSNQMVGGDGIEPPTLSV